MKLRAMSLALLVALLGTFAVVTPNQAMAAQPTVDLTVPVTGTLPGGETFTGTLSDLSFALDAAGNLVVNGVLNGTATIGGVVTPIIDQAFSVIGSLLNPGGEKCDILFLDLGPIFLDVLGLQVDLSQIVLDIDAVPGAGNLLGNLLCAVVHLLDNPGNGLGGLLNLLDRINDILG